MGPKQVVRGSAKHSQRKKGPNSQASNALAEEKDGVVLLSGGNPQIAKGYGEDRVQKYIEAMPGWKSRVGKRLDELIVEAAPGAEKAVKWNSPLYGNEIDVWFLGFHCLNKYVKVAFFRGAQLCPVPPGHSQQKDVRYLDIYENDELDEVQFTDWVRQAKTLPGVRM